MSATPASREPSARSATEEPAPLNFSTPQPLVTVIVDKGESQTAFQMPKNLISHHSPFFAAAFTSNFIEGSTQSMNIEDVDSKTFGSFVHWLYTQDRDFITTTDLQLVDQARLFLLAKRFLVVTLQDKLLDEIKTIEQATFSSRSIPRDQTQEAFRNFVYSAAVEDQDSELRKIAIVSTINSLNKSKVGELVDSLPPAMQADLNKALIAKCAALPGWMNGMGFAGVENRLRIAESEVKKRKRTYSDTIG